MIKYDTIGMVESEKGFPYIKAHADIPNWSLVGADFTAGASLALTSATKKADGIFLVDNTDEGCREDKIKAGSRLNLKSVKALDQQILVADESHIAYASGKSYDDIAPGTTLMGAAEDGRLEVVSASTGYAVYFKVVGKTSLSGRAVKLQVVAA
jgi:hypothetical protein